MCLAGNNKNNVEEGESVKRINTRSGPEFFAVVLFRSLPLLPINLTKESSHLLHAIHSLCYLADFTENHSLLWFNKYIQKIRGKIKLVSVYSWIAFVEWINEGRKPDKNMILRRLYSLCRELWTEKAVQEFHLSSCKVFYHFFTFHPLTSCHVDHWNLFFTFFTGSFCIILMWSCCSLFKTCTFLQKSVSQIDLSGSFLKRAWKIL